MTDTTTTDTPATAIALVLANPVLAFTEAERADQFLTAIAAEVHAHVPDVTTAKGRDAIKSLAFKVVKSKTALDDAGKALTEDARAQITKVDAARKRLRDALDALRDEAKAPLVRWEKEEADRVADCQATIATIKQSGVIVSDDTPDTVAARLEVLRGLTIDGARFQEFEALANAAIRDSTEALERGHGQLLKAAEEAAELEALRREKAERDAADAARAEQERLAAEAEAQRRADEEAAQRRAEQEQRDREAAEQRAREAAEAAAEQARQDERTRLLAEQALAAAEAQKAIDAANAETERLAQVERDRKAAEEREAKAKAAREADLAHRQTVLDAITGSLVDVCGLDVETARPVAMALAAGHIAHATVSF